MSTSVSSTSSYSTISSAPPLALALANTLFFAAATGESKGRVALYLLITIAPFAVIAPLIGPALDRIQHGRRAALAASFLLRTALAVVLFMNYDGATGGTVLSVDPRLAPDGSAGQAGGARGQRLGEGGDLSGRAR